MTITYYLRDSGGLITRHQVSGYDTLTDFFKAEFGRDVGVFAAMQAERTELRGWPETDVDWYDDVGIATNDAGNLRAVQS